MLSSLNLELAAAQDAAICEANLFRSTKTTGLPSELQRQQAAFEDLRLLSPEQIVELTRQMATMRKLSVGDAAMWVRQTASFKMITALSVGNMPAVSTYARLIEVVNPLRAEFQK